MTRRARSGEGTVGPEAWGRWLPPLAASAFLVSVAPFVGEVRDALAARLGKGLRYAVTAALLVAAAAVLAAALRRSLLRAPASIRGAMEPRAGSGPGPGRRLAALGLVVVLVALEVAFWTTGSSSSDSAERVHLLEYALVAALFDRALRPRVLGASRWVLTLEAVAFVGLADETVQWLTPLRVGDGRDVVLNVYAGLIGLLLVWVLAPPARGPGGRPAALRWILMGGALLVVATGAFFDAVHLGHEIDDPALGVFRSSFTPAGLARAETDRAARWARRSPLPLRPLGIEDTFLTEAGWHAQVRNAAVERGDLVQAWRENRILERWYAPFLRLPRRSWPAAQRAWIESRLGAIQPRALRPSPGYRSPALIGRLVVAPPEPLFWLGIAAAAGGLFTLGVKCSPNRGSGEGTARNTRGAAVTPVRATEGETKTRQSPRTSTPDHLSAPRS